MVMLFVCIGVQTCGLAASPRSGRLRGQQQDRTSFQSWSVCTCEDDHVVMERRVCHRQNWIPMASFFIIKSLGYLYGIQQWSVLKTPVCLYGVQCTGVGGFVIGEPRANQEDESEGPLSELLVSGHDNAATSSCLGSILFTLIFTCMWVAHTSFRRTKYIFECVFLRIIVSDKTWCKMLSPKFIRLINMVIIVILGITSCTSYLTSVPFLPKSYNW